jgi:hypothetical protein
MNFFVTIIIIGLISHESIGEPSQLPNKNSLEELQHVSSKPHKHLADHENPHFVLFNIMIASKLANSLEFRCLGLEFIQINLKPTLSLSTPQHSTPIFLFNSTTHCQPHTTLKTRIFSSIKLHIVNPTTLKTHIFSSIKLHIVNPTTLNTHFLFLFNYACQSHNTQHPFSLSIQLQKSWTHTHTLSLSHTHTQHPKKTLNTNKPFSLLTSSSANTPH